MDINILTTDKGVPIMNEVDAIRNRHSVRKYLNKNIEEEKVHILEDLIKEINEESGLNIQLITKEPEAFSGLLSRYGNFKNVNNYFALVGKTGRKAAIDIGYYGEKLVIKSQQLGLNTCWVGLNYKTINSAISKNDDEKLHLLIALGYGENQGYLRKSKTFEEVTSVSGEIPLWFRKGVELSLLAPTAMNQQKFVFTLENDKVILKEKIGFYSRIDLGIVKYHFEIGAGEENFSWG